MMNQSLQNSKNTRIKNPNFKKIIAECGKINNRQ